MPATVVSPPPLGTIPYDRKPGLSKTGLGLVVAAHALLQEPIGPDPASLAEALCGQQCACDKLPQILAAIASVRSQRG